MFLDPSRKLYSAFGLKRSVAEVWRISALVYYAEQKRAGRKLVPMYEHDDPTQMGGDFVISCHGNVALIHRSKVSTDRPTIDEIVSCLESLSGE